MKGRTNVDPETLTFRGVNTLCLRRSIIRMLETYLKKLVDMILLLSYTLRTDVARNVARLVPDLFQILPYGTLPHLHFGRFKSINGDIVNYNFKILTLSVREF